MSMTDDNHITPYVAEEDLLKIQYTAATGNPCLFWDEFKLILSKRIVEIYISYERESVGLSPIGLNIRSSKNSLIDLNSTSREINISRTNDDSLRSELFRGGHDVKSAAKHVSESDNYESYNRNATLSEGSILNALNYQGGVGSSAEKGDNSLSTVDSYSSTTFLLNSAASSQADGDFITNKNYESKQNSQLTALSTDATLPISDMNSQQVDESSFVLSDKCQAMVQELLWDLNSAAGIPWNIQRICEVLATPRRYYQTITKVHNALLLLCGQKTTLPASAVVSVTENELSALRGHEVVTQIEPRPFPPYEAPIEAANAPIESFMDRSSADRSYSGLPGLSNYDDDDDDNDDNVVSFGSTMSANEFLLNMSMNMRGGSADNSTTDAPNEGEGEDSEHILDDDHESDVLGNQEGSLSNGKSSLLLRTGFWDESVSDEPKRSRYNNRSSAGRNRGSFTDEESSNVFVDSDSTEHSDDLKRSEDDSSYMQVVDADADDPAPAAAPANIQIM